MVAEVSLDFRGSKYIFQLELQAKRLKHRWFRMEFTKFLKTYERLLLKPVVSPGVYFLISYTLAQIDTWFLYHNLQFCLPILPFITNTIDTIGRLLLHKYLSCFQK